MPKRVGFLYEKMLDRELIRAVILKAARYKRKRHDVRRVLKRLDDYVNKTYDMVAAGSFVPTKPHEKDIYDESSQKQRTVKIVPFWPDAVMHWLLVEVMRPVLMRGMYHWSCASIPGRGGNRIRKYLRRAMRDDVKGTRYASELDIRHYYPSIPVRQLMRALARKIKDRRFLRVIYAILQSCGGGLAIGYYICQWLANYYLETLDHYICSLPGVKYYSRHMDNITLLGPNKKLLHRAVREIGQYLRGKLGLTLKGNWQVYRTTFTAAAAARRQKLSEKQKRLRKPRMVAAVGYRFSHDHVTMRRRNFLRFARQCRRAKKRLDAEKPVSYRQAAGLLSRIGQLKHCDSHKIRQKYVDPIGVRNLKEVVRNASKRRQSAQQCLYAGGAA